MYTSKQLARGYTHTCITNYIKNIWFLNVACWIKENFLIFAKQSTVFLLVEKNQTKKL